MQLCTWPHSHHGVSCRPPEVWGSPSTSKDTTGSRNYDAAFLAQCLARRHTAPGNAFTPAAVQCMQGRLTMRYPGDTAPSVNNITPVPRYARLSVMHSRQQFFCNQQGWHCNCMRSKPVATGAKAPPKRHIPRTPSLHPPVKKWQKAQQSCQHK
jgi:hypothetical protein